MALAFYTLKTLQGKRSEKDRGQSRLRFGQIFMTISEVWPNNGNYFLSAIQREYAWHQDQIIALFDSLMRGYPISTFLFRELEPENYTKWEIYKFVECFNQAGTHNEIANTNGVQQLTLVLDGQQRLTSLLIGLKGLLEAENVVTPKRGLANYL